MSTTIIFKPKIIVNLNLYKDIFSLSNAFNVWYNQLLELSCLFLLFTVGDNESNGKMLIKVLHLYFTCNQFVIHSYYLVFTDNVEALPPKGKT